MMLSVSLPETIWFSRLFLLLLVLGHLNSGRLLSLLGESNLQFHSNLVLFSFWLNVLDLIPLIMWYVVSVFGFFCLVIGFKD